MGCRRVLVGCGIAFLLLGVPIERARAQAFLDPESQPHRDAITGPGLEEVLDRIGATEEQRADLRRIAKDAIDEGAPAGLVADLARRALDKGIAPDVVEEMLKRTEALAAEDLPSRPILDRYMQGIAKGVPFERIAAVCDRVTARLRDASQAVIDVYPRVQDRAEREQRRVVIDHAAYAMEAGIPAEILHRSLILGAEDRAPLEGSASAVLALGLLASGGIGSNGSIEIVSVAWQHGYRGPDLEKLGCDLGSLGRPGEPPSTDVIEGVLSRIRDGEARERILDDLEALRRTEEMGHQSPGGSPGEDPTHMHGPGGPPEEPDHQGHHTDGGGDHGGHR